MDYKEKYEKALEWMKSIYPTLTGADKEDAEHYFPELKESEDEDERIRKVLIHIVKSACSKYGIKYRGDDITEEKLLAYLEKQKPAENGGKELLYVSNKSYNIGYRDGKMAAEQKHIDPCDASWDAYYRRGYERGLEVGRKEQKTTEKHDLVAQLKEHLANTPKEQLDAEWKELEKWNHVGPTVEEYPEGWSEEDEKMFEGFMHKLEVCDLLTNKEIAWAKHRLKSLRLQPHDTYYDIIHSILKMLNGIDFTRITPEHRVSLLNDIRVKCKDADECAAILDEPSWKPSEEQMKTLQWWSELPSCSPGLKSLYEDLKKLM